MAETSNSQRLRTTHLFLRHPRKDPLEIGKATWPNTCIFKKQTYFLNQHSEIRQMALITHLTSSHITTTIQSLETGCKPNHQIEEYSSKRSLQQ